MDEPLDLEPIETRLSQLADGVARDRRALLAEVKRLRALLEQRDPLDETQMLDDEPVPPELPDSPCPDCELQLNADGSDYEHAEECPRTGTCGQLGPPWPDPPFHTWTGGNPDYPLDQSDEDHRAAMHGSGG